ncbi:MAG: MotA/TolQ/ExbB proton channel family protein [Lachnospiraceae bacterium]|nr:MotA/TolQ/ExbB proton channel family protein [Lachnospiraceae bacterium]
MDSFMVGLCNFLEAITNPAIIGVAILEFGFMCIAVVHLVGLRHRITQLNKKSVKPRDAEKTQGNLTSKIEMERTQNWEDFDLFLEDYQRKDWWYSVFSLIIQIFTLLGILGTVAGLYLAMKEREDIYRGVELALSTTVYGILFAVIYKLCDIVIVSCLINYIEDGINRYEKIYQVKNEEAKNVSHQTGKG